MSDSDDDWENAMDDAIAEKPKEEEEKKVDEDDYNSDEERQKIKAAKDAATKEVVAKKTAKEPLMTKQEKVQLLKETQAKQKKIDTTGMSAEAKGLALSMAEE